MANLPLMPTAFNALRRVEQLMSQLAAPPGVARMEPPAVDLHGVKGFRIHNTKDSPDARAAVLYIHGGAFIMGTPPIYFPMLTLLSRALPGFHIYAIEYRKAPAFPFPASLDDCVTAYRFLQEVHGLRPENIVLMGDSAGGNLAFTTTLYCLKHGLPPPAGVVGIAPWLDPALPQSTAMERAAWTRDPMLPAQRKEEVMQLYMHGFPGQVAQSGAALALRNAGLAGEGVSFTQEHPFVSPLRGSAEDFAGHPPFCIHVGTRDFLMQESLDFVGRMAHTCPNTAGHVKVWPGLPHVFPIFPLFVPEALPSLLEMARFIQEVTGITS
eukprot:GGOE01036751.1.p1 GENE.GGOE01036751.1~~GGOE01036751.1.p1  ORF type:complete len:367 (-),score=103.39 GGOE01036751.1:293-1267(-)